MKSKFVWTLMFLSAFLSGYSQLFEKQGAGVTILVHGWNPDASQPSWMNKMADAIIARSGGEGQTGSITVAGEAGSLTATCSNWDFDLANRSSGEIVVLLNWTAVANHLNTGITIQSVAAAVAPKIYQSQNGQRALSELPIHLIGHSRGGGMVFEIAHVLGLQGIEVEQVTSLDPHPLTTGDPQGLIAPFGPGKTIDAPVKIYENILFADNYFQDIEYPKGQYVLGAYNRILKSLPGGYHNETGYTYSILGTTYKFSDHLNIILIYHGTIDLHTPVTNGEAALSQTERSVWFNAYENAGANTGFTYSRIIGGERKNTDTPVTDGDKIIDGYHNHALLGGSGAREEIDWTGAEWPNVLIADVFRNGSLLSAGRQTLAPEEDLQISFSYRSYVNPCTISIYADTDRNPYNNNNLAALAPFNLDPTGSDPVSSSIAWPARGLPEGTDFYVYTGITDGSHTRYQYLDHEFEIVASGIDETDETERISIYPNPSKGRIHILPGSDPVKRIQVYDSQGRVLLDQTGTGKNETIDIISFYPGIYLISIQTGKSISVRKIIRE